MFTICPRPAPASRSPHDDAASRVTPVGGVARPGVRRGRPAPTPRAHRLVPAADRRQPVWFAGRPPVPAGRHVGLRHAA